MIQPSQTLKANLVVKESIAKRLQNKNTFLCGQTVKKKTTHAWLLVPQGRMGKLDMVRTSIKVNVVSLHHPWPFLHFVY